jgi:hypothetical protein
MGSRTSDSGVSARDVTARLATLEPAALRTVSVTVKAPAVAKAWLGCCAALVPPSPNSHDQDVGFPVELSENCTDWFTSGDAGENVNAADGMDGADGVDESGDEDVPPQAVNATAASTRAGARMARRPNVNLGRGCHPMPKWTLRVDIMMTTGFSTRSRGATTPRYAGDEAVQSLISC